jgi:PPOX class probable F420-dependent enzyme
MENGRGGTHDARAGARVPARRHPRAVWFVLDGDDLVFTAHETTVKERAVRLEPRVSLCVDHDTPPSAFVTARGMASVDADLGALRRWATGIGNRYTGADRAEEFGARTGVPGELLVRGAPTMIIGRDAMAA